MKKAKHFMVLAMAMALLSVNMPAVAQEPAQDGLTDQVVRLIDPATEYTTPAACKERDNMLKRVKVAGAFFDVIGMVWDAVIGPVRVIKNLIFGTATDAYADTTAARNHTCAKILEQTRDGG